MQSTLARCNSGEVSSAQRPFLALGESRAFAPGLDLGGRLGTPLAGIILLGSVAASKLEDVLNQVEDPAVPIADFGGNDGLRRDFVGQQMGSTSAADIRQSFAPIWQRLDEVPFNAAQGSRAELTILRLAYSRNSSITPRYAPLCHDLVQYPLIGDAAGVKGQLELLYTLALLRRHHFTRTHLCGTCESARLHVYEACKHCGGSDLEEEILIHHYRCGCQEPESHFAKGDLLVCPKCSRTLHHLGVDYGRPAKVVTCNTCHAVDSEPIVRFCCMECGDVTAAEKAATLDWYRYDLTEDGVRAMRLGRLPQFEIASFLERRTKTHSPRDFSLLAAHELKVAARFKLPFAIARFSVTNFDEILAKRGPVATEAGAKRIVDAVVAELRDCDFVGMGTMRSAMIGFPGTSAKQVGAILERIRRTVAANATLRLDLEVEVAEGAAIEDMLAKA